MTDRDRSANSSPTPGENPSWLDDPVVSHWLDDASTCTPADDAPVSDPESLSQTEHAESVSLSPDAAWSRDPAVSGWLTADEDLGATDDRSTAAPPAAAPSYDPDATVELPPLVHDDGQPAGSLFPPPVTGAAPAAQPLEAAVPRLRSEPPRAERRRRWIVAAVFATVVLIALVAGSVAIVTMGDTDSPVAQQSELPTPSATALAPSTPPPLDADCPNLVDGAVTTGRDPGGTTSGPAVIKAFEHAYYVERNGAKARSYGTELARMGSAESMQAFIDTQLPPDTLYCTRITERGNGLWALELSEIPPGGGEPIVIRQLVQTAEVDGKTVITAITKDPAT